MRSDSLADMSLEILSLVNIQSSFPTGGEIAISSPRANAGWIGADREVRYKGMIVSSREPFL